MNVQFSIGVQESLMFTDWGLEQIPRKGDFVQLEKQRSGYVQQVTWILGDDEGQIVKAPYVQIRLGPLS